MLKEIQILRPLLVIGIIIGHCFCIYSGSWDNTIGVDEILLYKFLNPFFISLGAFVMISGYITAYKRECYVCITGGVTGFAKKKFIRIYVPSMIFSVIYALMFIWGSTQPFSFVSLVKVLVFGTGHLWFLPMLFYNYCIMRIIIPIVDRYPVVSIVLSFLIMPVLVRVPDQIFVFLPYMILGYLAYGRTQILERHAFLLVAVWLVIFAARCTCMELFDNGITRFVFRVGNTLCSALAFFALAVKASKIVKNDSKTLIILDFFGKYSYGVYILQQFIIMLIVYKTPLFAWVGSIALPWVTALIAITASFGFSYLFQQTKVGKILLG